MAPTRTLQLAQANGPNQPEMCHSGPVLDKWASQRPAYPLPWAGSPCTGPCQSPLPSRPRRRGPRVRSCDGSASSCWGTSGPRAPVPPASPSGARPWPTALAHPRRPSPWPPPVAPATGNGPRGCLRRCVAIAPGQPRNLQRPGPTVRGPLWGLRPCSPRGSVTGGAVRGPTGGPWPWGPLQPTGAHRPCPAPAPWLPPGPVPLRGRAAQGSSQRPLASLASHLRSLCGLPLALPPGPRAPGTPHLRAREGGVPPWAPQPPRGALGTPP